MEFRSGLMRQSSGTSTDIVPTAAYAAYATLIQELYDAAFVAEAGLDPRDKVFLFSRAGRPVRVCWTEDPPVRLKVTATQPLWVSDMVGGRSLLQPIAGRVEIPLTADPIYVEGECKVDASNRDDVVIADSSHDYAYEAQVEQGWAGWSFGAVKNGVWAALTSEGTGEAWIVQPGREPLLYEFKGVPGPR
jgi:hypothetical protein